MTFHEVRSLSAHLYKKAGQDQKLIQDLMAHSSGKMTEHYQAGHEIERCGGQRIQDGFDCARSAASLFADDRLVPIQYATAVPKSPMICPP